MRKLTYIFFIILIIIGYKNEGFSQEGSNYEIVIRKDDIFDPQFVINKYNIGFWCVGNSFANNYSINQSNIKTTTPLNGFITKVNDSIFASTSLNDDYLYITYDFGENWKKYFIKPTKKYSNFFFLNENIIFFVDQSSNIYKSSDRGLSWTVIFTSVNLHIDPFKNTVIPKNRYITDCSNIYFYTENYGIFYIKYTSEHKIIQDIYYTIDGGKTWKESYVDENLSTVWKIKYEDNKYYIMLIDGRIMLSEDKGKKFKYKDKVNFEKLNYKKLTKGININNSYLPFVIYKIY